MYEQSQAHRIYEYHYKLNGLDVLKPGFHSVGSRCFRSEYQLFSLRGWSFRRSHGRAVSHDALYPKSRFVVRTGRAGALRCRAPLEQFFIALKIAVSAFDPMVMVFGRMLSSLVALMLLRVTVWRRAEAPMLLDRRVTRREWKYIVLLALCEPCFYFVFEGTP